VKQVIDHEYELGQSKNMKDIDEISFCVIKCKKLLMRTRPFERNMEYPSVFPVIC